MNTERCPSCGTELIMFPNALGYLRPLSNECGSCGKTVAKKSLWCRIKDSVKWERA
ncbi:MAG: hypothetical protein HY516_05510 [Candidatus Aenigmarchaeota archaeon]|nr:hypothetical protein [Candidatus Aenigmarchaeota archaeon]